MSKPCEYCGHNLPHGVDKRTRQIRSAHFASCIAKPKFESFESELHGEPLTDEEILEIGLELFGDENDGPTIRQSMKFARAIEAAHGITAATLGEKK